VHLFVHSLKMLFQKDLSRFVYAAVRAASASGVRASPKYRSNVVLAASKTRWQSWHSPKCRSISLSTEGESFRSKYQQIK